MDSPGLATLQSMVGMDRKGESLPEKPALR